MGKVKYLLIAAGLFVCFVMVFVMVTGVRLTERRMIKWSTVDSGFVAGEKVAAFMFPIVKEYQTMYLDGASPFFRDFQAGYSQRVGQQNQKASVRKGAPGDGDFGFTIFIIDLDENNLEGDCKEGQAKACVALKARRLFHKKSRSHTEHWISMYRLNKSQALVIYKSKTN